MTDKRTEERTETHACDSIDRQAAIDAFDCSIGGVPVESVKYVSEYADKMMSRINALPSAQSDVTDTNVGDLINRQAAIDAILAVTGNSSVRELYEHVQEHGLSDMWSGGVNAAIDVIIAVPAAQPDLSEYSDKLWRNAYERGKEEARIQKMQDLEQAEIQRAYELGKLDAMEEMPHWISCSERLPEDGVYLVYAPDYTGGSSSAKEWHNGIMFSKFKNGKWSIEHGYYERSNCVLAWMPLPEPYAERREEP